MLDTSVRYFRSSMSGAPQLRGDTAGVLIALLDACGINGFGSVTVSTLVVASGVATATVSTGHGFVTIGTTLGPVVRVEGANPSVLNGDQRITVVSATQFTFDATGISDQTATGTITAKMAPFGLTKAFSGTNVAAYEFAAVDAAPALLRIDNSAATYYGAAKMYSTMSDIDTGTEMAPSTTSYAVWSNGATSTVREWALVATDKFFSLSVGVDGATYWSILQFGSLYDRDLSTDVGAVYFQFMTATAGSGSDSYMVNSIATSAVLKNAYPNVSYTSLYRRTAAPIATISGTGDYPSKMGVLDIFPIYIFETPVNYLYRGRLGALNAIQANHAQIGRFTRFDAEMPDGTFREFITLPTYSGYVWAVDLTGPWEA